MEQLPEILVAVDEYRARMARVLAGLDDLQVAVVAQGDVDTATFLARATDHLRAGDSRLGHLAARLGPVDAPRAT
jgi:hypothetical protein